MDRGSRWKLDSEGGQVPLPRVLRQFWAASAVVFGLMFAVGYLRYRAGAPRPHYNPIGTVHFSDLMEYVPTFRLLHTAAFFHNAVTNPVAYPPFGAVFYWLLYATGHPVATYLLCAAVWLCVLTVGAGRWLRGEGVRPTVAYLFPGTVLAMAFPVLGMLCYGNIELFLWVFAATGVWALVHGRPALAALLWGCAAAMKLYPLIFLVLLVPRRQWRALACGVATFAGVTLASLWALGPTVVVALRGSVRNVFGYQGVRQEEWSLHELATNHSAFTWVKLVLRIADRPFAGAMLPYYCCGAALFVLMFAVRARRLPLANQLLCVTAFMLLFPPISYFHTLVHLFAPLVLLAGVALDAERGGRRVDGLHGAIALAVPLFGSFMLLTERRLFLFGGLLQGVLLLMLLYAAVRFPFAVADACRCQGEQSAGTCAAPAWPGGRSRRAMNHGPDVHVGVGARARSVISR